MHYDAPRLHKLNHGFDVEGNCANGTGATDGDLTCQAGGMPGVGDCYAGSGAGDYCKNGVAASEELGCCDVGTGVGTGCGTGNVPVS